MNFVVADTFVRSLGQLDPQWQPAVKQAAFDFQMNPATPGFNLHRLERAKDPKMWSCRVSQDIRIILHKDGDSLTLCYVDHHDPAYKWGRNRKIEVHPATGALQIVEVVERTEEVIERIVKQVEEEPPIFARHDADYLLALGVPPEWMDAIRTVGMTGFEKVVEKLPEEAAERLLELACGNPVPRPVSIRTGALAHPDSQRRFRVVDDQEELRRALEAPLDRWIIFLHPSQRSVVERDYSGPARVSGSAGTGKTVAALHRAVQLVKKDKDAKVLLTTFSKTLAGRLASNAALLVGDDADLSGRIRIDHLHRVAHELWTSEGGSFVPVPQKVLDEIVRNAVEGTRESSFSTAFVRSEWDNVIDAFEVPSFGAYRVFPRVGRGVPLGARQRRALWTIFDAIRADLESRGLMTWNQLCHRTAQLIETSRKHRYDHVVIDESQDFGPAELRLLRALVPEESNDLFFCGDPGQRIYRSAFSWVSFGIDTRGRSTRLKLNYRTTEQIRRFADRLLPSVVAGESEEDESRMSVSLLNGESPEVRRFDSVGEEIEAVAEWINRLLRNGYRPGEIAIFGRTNRIIQDRINEVGALCELPIHLLSDDDSAITETLSAGTMHRAKGLEFRAVAVMGCEKSLVPLAFVIRQAEDEADRQALIDQERQLLYVACTRARERLLLTASGELSRFLATGKRAE